MWDLTGQRQTMVDPVSGAVRTWPLSADRRAMLKEGLETAFGMLPFDSPASIPAGFQWGQVDSAARSLDGSDVYELRWTEPRGQGTEVQRKWRVTVDSKAGLPRRAEYSQRQPTDPDYAPETTVTVEYLTRDQVQAVIAACTKPPAAPLPSRP